MEESEEQSADSGMRTGNNEGHSFRLHMVTWNVATVDPPNDVTSLLQLNSPESPDLYVIGLQEVYSGPLRFVSDTVYNDAWSLQFMCTLGPLDYVKVSSIRMQGLLLLVFSKLEHVPFIRDIQASYTRTGIYRYWGNKGGVSVRLSFYGHTLCFLNCHLAAHMKYATERVDEFEYIMDTQTFDCKKAPRIVDHRLVFWFGDLNFRIEDHGMHFVRSCINNQTYSLLWSKDQLTMMKKKEQILQEFEEGPLDFQPTYKFDLNSDNYDSSGKKRKPAWTDRILWRLRPKAPPPDEQEKNSVGLDAKTAMQLEEEEEYPLKIRQDSYTNIMEYSISDHKPVIGVFTLELKKMYSTPLVRLQAEGDWSADMDAMVLYSPLQPFPSSTWDWIGLYKVGFTSASDYITYMWVKDDEVAFNEEDIKPAVSHCLRVPDDEWGSNMTSIVYMHLLWCSSSSLFSSPVSPVSDGPPVDTTMSISDRNPQQAGGPNLVNIEFMRNHSELFRAECSRLIMESNKACKRMQNNDNKQLDQRVRDIQFLKNELELKLEEIILEIDNLISLQSRVGNALEATREPLRVTVLCLEERMKRPPPERLHDEVDRELLKEREVIEGVASLLQRVVEQITEQIRLNRSAKYRLEQDLKEKFEAQCIDNSCALMTTHSINNQMSKNTNAALPSLAVTPKQWENISDINIAKAEQQKINSLSLQALVESVLGQTAADMKKQVQATTSAFQLNIQEIKSAKSQMEDQLAKILLEFASQQRIKQDLQVAITENEHALSLAQARLVLRRKRPTKEQCHDSAHFQLFAEVQQITAHISKLQGAVVQSDEQHRALVRCQLELQENIEIKASSLYIDEVICAQHREPIIIHNF
ncbi:Inositol polyphosphate 5-phosphatase K [Larimichthys crocea]|uniref:Uncharacterized protein n=1 Tax=Larimichthys crocea TaxID=215358 RepID=A0ACD3QM31_LARCR|nr:Inositol polyphosphate 5-phosphatase K [Larimichthys crocea]